MVAEPSVQLTTALREISVGNRNISQALSSLRHDIEHESALQGINYNARVIEGLGAQIAANFDQIGHVVEVAVGMANNVDRVRSSMSL